MTLTELLNAQQIAGARYQAAVDEFYAAYIELAALDGGCANSGVTQTVPMSVHFGQLAG